MYDAIIVGARCAGSATAMLLARLGYRVMLVDRATFPSDTISGHCIFHRGTLRLKRWGLLDRVVATNCPPLSQISSNFGDFTLTGEVPLIDGAPAAIGPRRAILDSVLLQAADEAGAEIREGFMLEKLIWDDDCVMGIQGKGRDGLTYVERARIVIGADGKHSKVAQLVQAPHYMEVPSLTCWYMSYWGDYACDGLELHWRPRRLVISMPTNDGQVLQAVAWPHAEFHDFRSDIEGNYAATLTMMPEIAARLSGARRESPFFAMANVPGFFCQPYGDGWALVGDAGHHKDPVPAHGISDAFCDAELLTEALDNAFSGRMSMMDALADYHKRRDERAIPDYQETCQRATLEGWDHPQMLAIRAALRDNPTDTGQFFGVVAKAVPPGLFFAPDNIQRIMQPLTVTAMAIQTPEAL